MLNPQQEALIKEVAEEAAKLAVTDALTMIGVDSSHPIEMQQDLAGLRELREFYSDKELQKDLIFIRGFRESMDSVKKSTIKASVGFLVLTALTAIFVAFWGKMPGG
jgi:hypothetical protein